MKRTIIIANALLFTANVYSQWWNDNFIIGMQFDPPANNASDVAAKYNQAVDAGFNLFTGELMAHSNNNPQNVYGNYFQSIKTSPTRPFFFSPRSFPFNSDYDGQYVWDEPKSENLSDVSTAINNIQNTTNKLGFVNLLPAYSGIFPEWYLFNNYINGYLGIQLQVLCFDNYYADSNFPGYDSQGEYRRYYSNLAKMRNAAGLKPLWSYILTSDRLLNYSSDYQRAYLRLSAFAPMAYGAKGILYYHYDQRDTYVVIRDLDYRTSPSWNSAVYYNIADSVSEYEVMFGNFNADASSHPHADIGIKTDEQRGKWYMKYTGDESLLDNRVWSFENEWYGKTNGACPFVTVWSDNLDHLGTIRSDGKMLLAMANKHWTDSATLAGISSANFQQLNRKIIAGGVIRGGNQPDLAVGIGNTISIYSDYASQNGFSGKQDFTGFNNLQQLQTIRYPTGDTLFAVCMADNANTGILYKYTASTNSWSGKSITVSASEAGMPDHFWLEQYQNGLELHMQDTGNKQFYGTVSANGVDINQYNNTNYEKTYKSYGVRNGAGGYDLYCIPIRSSSHNGLLNAHQEPTPRFGMVDTINHYLKDYIAPVVMNYQWSGCFHHNNTLGEEGDSDYDVVGTGEPVRALGNQFLMAGVFNDNVNTSQYRFLMVVNKGYQTIGNATVSVSGNFSGATLKPRIDTGSTTCTSLYHTLSNTTTISWPNMTAGECVVVDLTP